MNLHGYFEKFCAAKRAQGRSPITLECYQDVMGAFFTWCESNDYRDSDLMGMTGAENIEDYLNSLRQRGLTDASVHTHFRHLRAVYKWIYRRFNIEGELPFDFISAPSQPALLPKAISASEVAVLLHSFANETTWIAHRDRVLVKLLFSTGLRAGEALSLVEDDVDLEHRRIRVIRWKVKTEGFVPISKSLVNELKQWIETRPKFAGKSLWPSKNTGHNVGLTLQYDGMKQMLRRRCERAGLPNYRPHSFRHGAAVNVITRGGDISLVKELLGHRDLTTSQVYLRFNTDQVLAMYDKVFD